jgi:hypothetical protein
MPDSGLTFCRRGRKWTVGTSLKALLIIGPNSVPPMVSKQINAPIHDTKSFAEYLGAWGFSKMDHLGPIP